MMPRTVKVAVVGSGLAGLTAAYLLSRSRSEVVFEIHLFEKASSLGMDSMSVSIPVPGRKCDWRIDVPMRSFQGGYYPQLIQLYKSLGVAFRHADFSYSFSLLSPATNSLGRKITTTMIYNGASGREGVSMPSIFNQPYLQTKGESMTIRACAKMTMLAIFTLMTIHVVFNYLRLILFSVPCLRPSRLKNMTFREWTSNTVPRGILARWSGLDASWEDFTKHILVPLFSAVCTASETNVMEHPMEEFLDYVWLTFGTHHYVVMNGVKDVVSRLASDVQHIHVASPITAIYAEADNSALASIQCSTTDGTKVYTGFNHIIFGTQANNAVPLLESYLTSLPIKSPQRQPVEEQIHCLRTFKYHSTIVINHTDSTLCPDAFQDRRDLNLICLGTEGKSGSTTDVTDPNCVSSSCTMTTHALTPPSHYPSHLPAVYQTTNPIISPCKESILSIAHLERAVLTQEAKGALPGLYKEKDRKWWQCAAQCRGGLGPLQGAGKLGAEACPGIWVCGSYAYPGIPLLEGCVVSARNVVEQGVFESEGLVLGDNVW